MSKRVTWKENKVVSIKVKDGVYVLAQMLVSPYLLIFNCFNKSDDWVGKSLDEQEVLFCQGVTRQFLKQSSVVVQKDILPLTHIEISNLWIQPNPENYMVKLWENTADEIEFIMIGEGGGTLVEMDIYEKGFNTKKVIDKTLSVNSEELQNYESTSLAVYPALNERLFLCYSLQKKVNPELELIYNMDLPRSYKNYFNIVSGKKKISECGY